MNDASSMLSAAAAGLNNSTMLTEPPVQNPGMSKISALLTGQAEQKQQQVAATADAKRVALGGMPDEQTFKNAAVSRVTGAGRTSSNPIERDLSFLSWDEMEQKYGQDVTANMLQRTNEYRGLQSGERSREDLYRDSVKGAFLGGADMIGGIGALGLSGLDAIGRIGGANTHMGVTAASGIKAMNDAVEGSQSALLQNVRSANEEKGSLQSRDSDAQYEEDKANGNSTLVAGLKKIGTNALNSAANTVSNPTLALDAASSAAGSLLGAGPITKGVSLATKVLPKAMQAASIGPWGSVSDRLAAAVGSKLPGAEAVGVGSMFAGGSYQGTAAQVASMDQGQLDQLPPYQALIAQGLSPDDARAQLADKAGQMAAGIAAPAGMLAGSIAKKVIRNPFAAKDLEDTGHNIAAMTAEQALQGAGGQAANNVGIQQNVNPNQDLTAGVGEALGQGVVGGLGTGIAMQAPAMAAHGVKAAVKGGADAFNARLATIRAANDKASPISDDKMAAAGEAAQEVGTSEPTNHALADMVQKAHAQDALNSAADEPADTTLGSDAERLAGKITDLSRFDPSEIANSNLPNSVKEQVGGATHRVDLMQKLADVVNDKGPSTDEGMAAAVHLYDNLVKFQSLANDPAQHDIPKDAPASKIVDTFNKFASDLPNSPKILEAMKSLMSMSDEDIAKLRKPEEVATLAAVAPERSNLRSVQLILDDHDSGKIKLTAEQHQALLTAQAILSAAKNASDAREKAGLQTRMSLVTDDILSKDSNKADRLRSSAFYAKDIFERMRAGDTEGAHASLSTLGDFADHMNNKSDAVNQHYVKGGGALETFEARNPDNGQLYDGKGQGVTPTSPKSVDYAQTVNLEAKQVSDVYNGMSKAFPQLKGGEKTTNELHHNLQGTPKDVAQAHRNNRDLQPRVAAASTGSREEAKLPDRETQNQNKTTSEQLVKNDEVAHQDEATSREGLPPQAESFDKGASAKEPTVEAGKLEEKPSSEATPNIVRDNVAGASGKDTSEHIEALSNDMRQLPPSKDRSGVDKLNTGLEKLSDTDFMSVLNKLFPEDVRFTHLTDDVKNYVSGITADIAKRLGIDSLDKFVRSFINESELKADDDGTAAGFYGKGMFVALTDRLVDAIIKGRYSDEQVFHMLAHEIAHSIDFHASTGSDDYFNSTQNPNLAFDGPLWKEFLKLKDAVLPKDAIRPFFDYIEGQETPEAKTTEFFAELGAFSLQHPDLAQELIPNGKQAFEAIHDQAKQALGLEKPTVNNDRPLGEAVRPEKPTVAITDTKLLTGTRDAGSTDAGELKAEPAKTLKEAYPELVGTKDGKNWFHKAFELAKDAPSRLVGLAEPFKALAAALASHEALEDFLGDDKRKVTLTPEVARAYKGFLSYAPMIADAMEARLAKKIAKGDNASKILTGEAGRWADSRVLNFAEQKPDGSFGYNRPLLEQSILAAFQHLLTMNRYRTGMDADKVSALTGIPKERCHGLVDQLDFGLSPLEAVQSLADKLTDFWGVRASDTVGNGHTDGIPLAMAAELLSILHNTTVNESENPDERGLLRYTKFVVKDNTLVPYTEGAGKPRTVERLEFNIGLKPGAEKTGTIFAAPSLIEEAVLKNPVDKNYHEGDEVPVKKTQMNNPNIRNTPEQLEAIAKLQETQHFLDKHTYGLYSALTDKIQQRLFGGGDLTDRKLNQQDQLSLKGQNTSVSAAWDSVRSRVAEIANMPKGLETAMKFQFNISSIGRHQMLGGQTGQGSKGVREVITPTWSTIDIRSKGGDASSQKFWNLALAQGLGLKVHTLREQARDVQLAYLLKNKFKGSIEQLRDHLNGVTDFSPEKFADQLEGDFEAAGLDLTHAALKALTEHARWLDAGDNERANFKTSIYVEADGVTNGPSNALHLYTADHFDAEQIENYARGGKFFDGTKTMNEYRAKADSKDLYTVGSDHTQANIDSLRASVAGTPVERQLDHLSKLLGMLAKGVKYNIGDKDLNTDRGVIKNPMQITIYGSGPKGIAGNIADVMTRKFYTMLSATAQSLHDNPGIKAPEAFLGKGATREELNAFMDSLNSLITQNIGAPKSGLELWAAHNGMPAGKGNGRVYNKPLALEDIDPENFKFSKEHFNCLQQNLLHLFVKPMVEGINTALGDSVADSAKTVQQTNQVQSVTLEYMFNKMVKTLQDHKAKDPDYSVTDGISKDDIRGILKALNKQFPMLTPDGQVFSPVGNSPSDTDNTTSRALEAPFFQTSPQLHAPSDGGVKSKAMLTIGMGDANTVQKAITKYDAPMDSLWVFDGVNFSVKDIARGSEVLNHSSHDAQQGNPSKTTLKAYNVFMKSMTPEFLEENPGLLKALSGALDAKSRKDDTSLGSQVVLDILDGFHTDLAENAKMVDIRHQVMREFESYNDNMAAAESPFKNEGKSLAGLSSQEIADALNKRVNEILAVRADRGSARIELPPEQPTVADLARQTANMQNPTYGEDSRLSELKETFNDIFSSHLKSGDPVKIEAHSNAVGMSADLVQMAKANGNGFQMTQQARDVFSHVVTALSLNTKLDPNSISRMNDLYQHVLTHLTPSMLENKADPDQVSREAVAQTKYDMITGNLGTKTFKFNKADKEGLSSLLPVFMGLALVDNGFRNALHDMPMPKKAFNEAGTVDASASNLGNRLLGSMADSLSGQGNSRNLKEAIDALTKRVGETALNNHDALLEQMLAGPNTLTNRANGVFVGWMGRMSDKALDVTLRAQATTNSTIVKHAARFGELMAGLVTEKNGALAAEGIMSQINRVKGFTPLREVIADLVGRTDSNGHVYDKTKLSNSMISKLRQEFRDNLPKFIAEQFDRKLTPEEWAQYHQVFGKSDLPVLADGRSNSDVLNIVADPRARTSEIRKLESKVSDMDPKFFAKVQEKAMQLAEHMMKGTHGNNLLSNADSVAHLNGERGSFGRKMTPEYVKAVDHLTTLYALDKMDKPVQKSLTSLVQTQGKGSEFLLNYLVGQRKDEVAKATGMARFNALKGYIPTLREQGASLIVASDKDSSKLLAKSYVRVGDYKGSDMDTVSESKGYYYAPVAQKAGYNQGSMQNATHTAGGVEVSTGRSEGLTAGLITSPAMVARITKNLLREGATTENLKAIYNDRGKPIAYERTFDPTRLASMNQEAHIANSIGVWRGRQVEEGMSEEFNRGLVDRLKEMYVESSKKGNQAEYIDLNNPKSYGGDKIIQDGVALMTPDTRAYFKEVFGENFMVRRDMVLDVIGARKATVGDAWTGTSRWSQETQDAVRNMATSIFGNKAYQHMVNAESMYQGVVKEAKTLIVVKSVIVPLSNMISNLYQLAARGVPITDMVRNMPRKIDEAEIYNNGRIKLMKYEARLREAEGAKDFNSQIKIKAQMQTINDGFKRLSIWPLINAGEMGAISHSDQPHEDGTLTGGKLHEYVDGLVDKLPKAVQTAGRYALVTKDTALFKGLQKAVEYGDFLGKAIQYDHYINKKGLTSEQALARISEEYVNFDKLPGRARGYLDSMGLMWFMNFKLRTSKVALSMIRENPLQALLGSMVPHQLPGIGSFGTPFSDNIAAKAFSGHLGYSLGPDMMLHAPMLNPTLHVLSKL